MLINNDPFHFILVIVYLNNICFILISNLTSQSQLHLEQQCSHISWVSFLPNFPQEDFDDGSSKANKFPIFNVNFGIEALLHVYVEERFRKIASCTLLWTAGLELFNGYEEVLLDMALTNWEDLVFPINDVEKNSWSFWRYFTCNVL